MSFLSSNVRLFASSYAGAAVAEWYRHRIVAGFVMSSSPVSLKTRREIAPQTLTPVVGSVYLGHRKFGCRCSPGPLLTNTWSSLAPRQNLLSSENTTDLYSSSNELWLDTTGVSNDTGLESVEYVLKGAWFEAVLKKPISNSSLCQCGTNCSSNFCRRCNTMGHSRTPNTAVFLPSSAPWPLRNRFS
ncbi:hypothetical protein TNCV_812401 [Trichonephila clavipes]|nr:hypothetical protein TNCV_812401 [Trichonephila clavipes]